MPARVLHRSSFSDSHTFQSTTYDISWLFRDRQHVATPLSDGRLARSNGLSSWQAMGSPSVFLLVLRGSGSDGFCLKAGLSRGVDLFRFWNYFQALVFRMLRLPYPIRTVDILSHSFTIAFMFLQSTYHSLPTCCFLY